MSEILINDLVEELSEDNKRLLNFFNEFHIYLQKLLSLKTTLEELNQLSPQEVHRLEELESELNAILTSKTTNGSNGDKTLGQTERQSTNASEELTTSGQTMNGHSMARTAANTERSQIDDQRLYECPHDDCAQVFTTGEQLREHSYTVHTHPYWCPEEGCGGQRFRVSSWLDYHRVSRHPHLRPLECPVDGCGRRFRTADELAQHRDRRHSTYDKTVAQIQRQTLDVKTQHMSSHSLAVKMTKKWTPRGQTIGNSGDTDSAQTSITGGGEDSDRTDQSVNRRRDPPPTQTAITGADPAARCGQSGVDNVKREPEDELMNSIRGGSTDCTCVMCGTCVIDWPPVVSQVSATETITGATEPSMAYECPNQWCGQRFPKRKLLDRHWAAAHRTTKTVVTVDLDEEPDPPLPAAALQTTRSVVTVDLEEEPDLPLPAPKWPCTYPCPECGRRCWQKRALAKHRLCHYPRADESSRERRRHQITRSDRDVINQSIDNNMAVQSSTGAKVRRAAAVRAVTAMTAGDPFRIFHCLNEGCGKRFRYSGGLRSHSRVIHPEDHQIPCGYRGCRRLYKNIAALNAHRLAAGHMGPQPLPPRTTTIAKLRAQIAALRANGGRNVSPVAAKPTQCRAVGCGKWFTNVNYLRSHRREDHGLDAYRCDGTGCKRLRFDSVRDLKAHKRTAHNVLSSAVTITTSGAYNRFNCGCGQWFATMEALARHRRQHKSYRCRTDGPNRSVPTPSGGQSVVDNVSREPEDKSVIAAALVAEMSRQARVGPIGEVSVTDTSALFEYQSHCILTADIKTESPDVCSGGDQSVGTVDDVKPVIIASTAAEGVRRLRGRPQKSMSTEAVASAPTDQVFVKQSDSDSRQTVDPKASSSDQKMDSLLSQDMSVAETSALFPEYESHCSLAADIKPESPDPWI